VAKKKSTQQVEIKIAEIRSEARHGQPQMIWHLPFVVTASGAGAALKGIELAAKGVGKAIEARVAPLEFYITSAATRRRLPDSQLMSQSGEEFDVHDGGPRTVG
jgi:hypothetical protein